MYLMSRKLGLFLSVEALQQRRGSVEGLRYEVSSRMKRIEVNEFVSLRARTPFTARHTTGF